MTAADRYETLSAERSPFLRLAEQASELTIPSLIPPSGSDGTDLPTPFQSVGARGVNNLAAKLLLALFPPQGAFFRLTVDENLIEELEAQADEGMNVRAEAELALSAMERAVMARIEATNARSVLSNGFKHLLVGGNYLVQELDGGNLKGHPLSDYVVKRDLEGNVVDVVVLEELAPMSAPERVREMVKSPADDTRRKDDDQEDTIKLYTWMYRDGDKYKVHQEVEGKTVPGSEGSYPLDAPAFIPLRWNPVDGSSYGRGLAQEYLGDLQSLESLSQSVIEFAAAAAKILFLVDPGGRTDARELRDAASGEFVEGDEKDITVLMLEKFADFQVAKATADDIEQRLEEAFLLNSSVQRHAERVTAEEIRFMAGELEQALGGVYSALSEELQRPLVNRWIQRMQKEDALPDLPKNVVKPKIITGIEGLGRQSDLQRLDVLVQGIGQMFGPDALSQHIDVGAYIRRRAAALGLDEDGLVRSDEEIQAAIERQRQAQLREAVAPQAVQATGRLAEKAADVKSEQPES